MSSHTGLRCISCQSRSFIVRIVSRTAVDWLVLYPDQLPKELIIPFEQGLNLIFKHVGRSLTVSRRYPCV